METRLIPRISTRELLEQTTSTRNDGARTTRVRANHLRPRSGEQHAAERGRRRAPAEPNGPPTEPSSVGRRAVARAQPRRTASVWRAAEATAASRTAATSSAVSVRSAARSRSENASDLLPAPTWSPSYTSNSRTDSSSAPGARDAARTRRPPPAPRRRRRSATSPRPPGSRDARAGDRASVSRRPGRPGPAPSRRCAAAGRAPRRTFGCSSPAWPTMPLVQRQHRATPRVPGLVLLLVHRQLRAARRGRRSGPPRPRPPRTPRAPRPTNRRSPRPPTSTARDVPRLVGQRGLEHRELLVGGPAVHRQAAAARSRPGAAGRPGRSRTARRPRSRARRCAAASRTGRAAAWCAAAAARREIGLSTVSSAAPARSSAGTPSASSSAGPTNG